MSKGVSIVICCYNSAPLLPETLHHVCEQKTGENVKWEVIVIDNNSTDNTSEIAKKYLNEFSSGTDYKIFSQPVAGLSSARKMGLDKSQYEYILFCDDDNWLDENYVETGFRILETDKNIGALGGQSEAVTEGQIPSWFLTYKQNYSIGLQSDKSKDITWSTGVLWGAGMFVRASALKNLYLNDFKSLLIDRKGNQLSSGGDSELCYALRLAGWKIRYDEKLKLKHFITKERLSWKYLRKLSRGFGAQKVNFDPYLKVFDGTTPESWRSQALKLIGKLRGYGFRKLLKVNQKEGDPEILRLEKTLGRLNELLKIRGEYNKRIVSIRNAKWRKIFSPGKPF